MTEDSGRKEKVSQELKKTLANILRKDIRDPRLSNIMLTVSDVEVSKDLKMARVFVTFLGNENISFMESKISVLASSSRYIHCLLSKRMKLRRVPSLNFFYDQSLISGLRISRLITKSLKADEKIVQNEKEIFHKNEPFA